jgi:CHAT domain-containing protein
LEVSELQFLRSSISTRLVVLSACKTAVGRDMKGEGVFSFAREFAAAGIPSTIATLRSVDDQSTYQLTEFFHKYLSEGFPADIALQKAKIEFLNTNDAAKQLPYFWAAHILIGETNIIDKATFSKAINNYAIPTVSLALLLALGIGLKLKRRK